MFAEGAKLRRTRLTDEYTLEHYRTELPENALLLFYGREGRMQVATGLPDTAQAGTVLIALVPPPGAPDTVPGSHSPEQPQPVSPQEATTNVAEPEQMDTGR
ncbi:hypothetical protein [Deinococcus radiophilus]